MVGVVFSAFNLKLVRVCQSNMPCQYVVIHLSTFSASLLCVKNCVVELDILGSSEAKFEVDEGPW